LVTPGAISYHTLNNKGMKAVKLETSYFILVVDGGSGGVLEKTA
jgi:hypothetical protein